MAIKAQQSGQKVPHEAELKRRLRAAQVASRQLALIDAMDKNALLYNLADQLQQHSAAIIEANQHDVERASERGLSPAMLDRLALDEARVSAMAASMRAIAELDDPVGQTMAELRPLSGLKIQRVRVPLGVVGVIYESRPNVTIDAAALCFKSGNAVMLRGGSEASYSNTVLINIFQQCLKNNGFSAELVQGMPSNDRALVGVLLRAQGLVDVVVPRGGKSLVERVMQEARVPVFAHLEGIVHIYVDQAADILMAQQIVTNAKMRRTSICGAAECLLLHQGLGREFMAAIIDHLLSEGCEIRGDTALQALDTRVIAAQEDDFGREFLDAVIAAKIVRDQAEAEAHIAHYGSHHTDVIITEDQAAAEHFFHHVDSAIVMHNASSQFADGGEFGMGAEIGIATGRIHARGPVGLEQLTTFHYRVRGDGQIRPL